jgi:flagellin
MDALKTGSTINIGGKGYTIGTTIGTVRSNVTGGAFSEGSIVTINGIEYTITKSGVTKPEDNIYTAKDLASIIADGDKVTVGTNTYVAMKDEVKDGIGDNDPSIISANKAYTLIQEELRKASSIGADAGSEASVSAVSNTNPYNAISNTQVTFTIKEASRAVKQGLQMGLHVGADADGTNKITFKLDAMTTAGLGIKNMNVVDSTGAKATYAIDSIADAISMVSAQRSTLGAVQNRLEHTINNLDNIVENTTSAESEIRDTDMAEEMVEYSKNNILAQAGQSMLAQANQATQGVMNLLQ